MKYSKLPTLSPFILFALSPLLTTAEVSVDFFPDTLANDANYGSPVLTFENLDQDGITFTAPSVFQSPNNIFLADLDPSNDSFPAVTSDIGSFTITMEGFNGGFDGTTIAGLSSADIYRGSRNGSYGVSVGSDNRITKGEVIQFTVALDNDFVASGFQLELTSLNDLAMVAKQADAFVYDKNFTFIGTSTDTNLSLTLSNGDTFYYGRPTSQVNSANRNQFTGMNLSVTAIPEPSTYAAFIGLIALLAVLRRRA